MAKAGGLQAPICRFSKGGPLLIFNFHKKHELA